MRYSQEHSEETRKRILDAAARKFREHGYGGVGIDALARSAGVTSGAFYSHFPSKAQAFKAVVIEGLIRLRAAVSHFRGGDAGNWFERFSGYYLGKSHRADVGGGCALPSLSSEVWRADAATREQYQAELERVAQLLAESLGDAVPRAASWPLLAQLAGGVLLARAVKDEEFAAEIEKAVLASIRDQAQSIAQGER